jgi:hypothetical protein
MSLIYLTQNNYLIINDHNDRIKYNGLFQLENAIALSKNHECKMTKKI